MAALYPDTKDGKVAYFQSKIAPWTASATTIGTTTAAVTAMDAKVTVAQDKLAAQVAATQLAKAATAAADDAIEALVLAGGNIIADIRAAARNSADPANIYELAQIPAPATPTPVGELGKASNFGVTLLETGELDLSFKCTNPRAATGTFYTVWRRIGNVGAFICLGGCGSEKKFLDSSVPAGSASVTYKIQATRSGSTGPWAQFVVNFGVDMGETTVASIVETSPKLAA